MKGKHYPPEAFEKGRVFYHAAEGFLWNAVDYMWVCTGGQSCSRLRGHTQNTIAWKRDNIVFVWTDGQYV